MRPILLTALLAFPLLTAAAKTQPELVQIAKGVQQARLHATVAKLVSFGTRHTLSDRTSETRGIGAAERWTAAEFEAISKACGGCLTVAVPKQTFTGRRVPNPTEIGAILAIQKGTTDPDRVIVISGHIDSRVSDVMDATSDAPGANDDGSGVAAVIEAARVLSKHKFPATLVFAVLEGEEQGLYGGKVLAAYAKAQGWRVEADLNNDIIGNTRGASGVHNDRQIRVFSEGTKAVETQEQANSRRYNGGEVDSPSRNLARFADGLADTYLKTLDVVMVYRTDRYGRGGDQVEMLNAGIPAIRVTEAAEHYDRQHQDLRTESGRVYGDTIEGVDFPYLAKVTRLNVIMMAALANAPAPPEGVKIEGAVSPDTKLSWTASPGAASYRVHWRETTAPRWQHAKDTTATAETLKNVVIDDWFFGVSAISADGYESPVVFPGAAGSFSVTK
ncbi:MAG: M20/M25/M40 family metallo-hydrolase [Phenylobacterium sp.]|uniref:M20/M25/M40 family metallo-hydrolase n=1 Tax=Phenylobacterium sp. TaxID=1871053 RepID=UPI002730D4C9|nr:M20/M25/M40 family metallo-hydrolase [Phenylobacterium sp.]MDP2011391.1 M20/M25/M40 family metallo-hydrolase [Phenylobacterium sp.]